MPPLNYSQTTSVHRSVLNHGARLGESGGMPPHPQPLSRKGRGEEECERWRRLRDEPLRANLLPSPPAGEGLGVRGTCRRFTGIAQGHLAVAVLMLLGSASLSASEPAAPLFLKPARVFDGVNDEPHEGWIVLVRGERIEQA